MPDLKILIRGEALVLAVNEDQEFNVSKVVHDLRDLETRNSDFSQQITLPLVPTNTRLLGSLIPSLARFDDAPLTNVAVEVLAFGVPIISDAFLVITGQDEINKTVTASILGGNAKFYNQLKEEPLSALDLSEYDFEWTLDDILAEGLTQTEEGVVVPNCLWYNNESRRLYESKGGSDLDTFLQHQELGESGFFFYIRTMLEEIFSGLSNLVVDISLVDAFILDKAFSVPVPIVHDSFGAVDGSYSEVQVIDYPLVIGNRELIPYPIVVENPLGYWNPLTNQYEFIESGFFIVTVLLRGSYDSRFLNFQLIKNFNAVLEVIDSIQFQFEDVFEDTILTTVNVIAGDTLSMHLDAVAPNALLEFSSFSIEEQGTGRGRSFNVADMMPDITQKNFVKEVFKLMNIVTTEENNVVTLHQFDEIRTKPPIEGIRLDQNKEITLATDLLTYGKVNIMKYSDNERVERLDSYSEFYVNSTIIKDEVIKVNSLFYATDQAVDIAGFPLRASVPNYDMHYEQVNDNNMHIINGQISYTTTERNSLVAGDLIAVAGFRRRVVVVIDGKNGVVDLAWTATANDQDWELWRYDKFAGELHIAEMSHVIGSNFAIWDGGLVQPFPSNTKLATFPPSLLWNQIKVQFYSLIVDSVETPFIVQAFANVSILDFVRINGINSIYLDEYKAYFYINKMEQWNLNNSVRLELIELKI